MAVVARRRTVDELIQRYRLNRGFGIDIYVEGSNDKQLFEIYLRRKNASNAVVYGINSVEVNDGELIRIGLNPGSCRNRVIVLKELLTKAGAPMDGVRFVVDRDQEDLCSLGQLLEGIRLSDWGALEMALVHERSLQSLVETFANGAVSPEQFVSAVFSISRHMYLMRAAARRLDLPLKFVTPSDFIFISGGRIIFNASGYLNRVVVASSLLKHLDSIRREIDKCAEESEALALSREVTANDHDVLSILLRIIRIFGGLANRAEGDVRSLLLMAIDFDVLDSQSVFHSILED